MSYGNKSLENGFENILRRRTNVCLRVFPTIIPCHPANILAVGMWEPWRNEVIIPLNTPTRFPVSPFYVSRGHHCVMVMLERVQIPVDIPRRH